MNSLILGAGLMQKPAILSAKELGYRVCVVDADENAISIPFADEFCKIDLKDKDGILSYAEKLSKKENGGLALVFTAGTDFSSSVSYVSEKLGLPSHSYKASLNASVKTLMRKCFEAHNVPSPAFINATEKDDFQEVLKKTLKKMQFPFVVKPVDNMGARGCRMVRSESEFESALKVAISCSRTKNAIIEEYMEGPEYSIDALIHNGTFTVTGFALRHIKYPPYFIEVGHTMSAELEQTQHDMLISTFALGAKALSLTEGAAKADIKFTKKGPMIGEIAGRLSGGYMSGWTFPYASGLNLTREAILIASGKEPLELIKRRERVNFLPPKLFDSIKTNSKSEGLEKAEKNHSFGNFNILKEQDLPYELFEVPCKNTCAERAWISIPGTIENIEDINEFSDMTVCDILPRSTCSINSKVNFPRNNVEKCGNVIALSRNREQAVLAAENAVSNIFISLKPFDFLTENFLAGKKTPDEKDFPPPAFFILSSEEKEKISGSIPKNAAVSNYIPEFLKKSEYCNLKDWNYNTIAQTARKFDLLRKNHSELDSVKFFDFLLKGGLQGAVYYSDCLEARGKKQGKK